MFDLNWNKKIKIVINGKQYDRLEDVPEEFRSLLKDSNGDGIPDVASLGKKTWKLEPLKIHFPPGEPLALDPSVPVAPPNGFRIDDGGRRVSWRWFTWPAVGGLVFAVLWDGILAAWLYCVSLTSAPWFVTAGGVLMTAIGVGMTYSVIALLLNRTSLRVDAAEVSVRHGPLPWREERDVRRADIDSVFCEKIVGSDETLWDPALSYTVKLALRGGRTLNLVAGLRAPEQALFIEQLIRKNSV